MTGRPQLDYQATIPGLLGHALGQHGAREFVVTETTRITYREADVASRSLAKHFLALGVAKGTRLGAQLPYGNAWIVAFLAATRIGALFVPLSTAYKPPELAKVLRLADIQILLMPERLFGRDNEAFLEEALPGLAEARRDAIRLPAAPYLRTILIDGAARRSFATPIRLAETQDEIGDEMLAAVEAEVTPADLMVTIYTSGTTSEPKGVLHTHGALVRHGANLAHALGHGVAERIFCGMPFFWIGGLAFTVLPAMHSGATLICMEQFEAGRAIDLMEREQVTRMTGWPGVSGPVLRHPTLRQRQIPMLTNPRWSPLKPQPHSSLGMTETCGPHTGGAPETWDAPVPGGLSGSMGPPIRFVDHKIADPATGAALPEGEEGAICVRSYSLMTGMYKREREDVFDPDGWYDTGDRGFFKDGILFLRGRTTEMIKTSGNNVAPPEVEAALLAQPGIQQAHVLGLPDPERDEIVAAGIVAAPGAAVDGEALREVLRRTLSNYKVPREFVVLREDEVPWLATGKVDRLRLKQLLGSRLGRTPRQGQTGPIARSNS